VRLPREFVVGVPVVFRRPTRLATNKHANCQEIYYVRKMFVGPERSINDVQFGFQILNKVRIRTRTYCAVRLIVLYYFSLEIGRVAAQMHTTDVIGFFDIYFT
jgi:hypothetical protein